MVPKFEMSTYFYSHVIWLQSGPRMSTLIELIRLEIQGFKIGLCGWVVY